MSEFFVPASNDPQTKKGFYERRQEASLDSEAERLQSAAVKMANPISLDALSIAIQPGNTVLDIGAGADSNLGKSIENAGCRYIAVEPNNEFVVALQNAEIDVRQGDVADVPIASNSVDAVHMRFVFGWLNERQRKSALEQAVRTLKIGEPKDITIIDYDWLAADGPDEYLEAIAIACSSLKSFGFDYGYGGQATADIQGLVNQGVLGEGVDYEVQPSTEYGIDKTLADGLPIIEEAVASLKEGLSALGDTDGLSAIEEAVERVRRIDPNVRISLPSIVSQVVTIMKHEPSAERASNSRAAVEESFQNAEYDEILESTAIEGVAKVVIGSDFDNYIRRVQAAEYLKEGMLTSEAMIEGNGVLCEESYPESLVEQSLSFAAFKPGVNTLAAAVRLIEAKQAGSLEERLRSLPTADHLDLDINDQTVFPEGASVDGVVEVSAFIRNSKEGGGLVDMARVVLGAAAEAKARGHHTGLMTTHKSSWRFLKGIFGEGNFKVLEDAHVSNTPGASDKIEFVCLSVDVQSFLDGVYEHAARKKETSRALAEVHSLLEAYYARPQAA